MKKIFLAAFFCAYSLSYLSVNHAAPAGDCAGTPGDAILDLPVPFNAWGQIVCNGAQHAISGKGDWFWKGDSNYSQVSVSSTGQYFIDIQVRELNGKERTKYVSILEGKASKSKPKTFILELTADNNTHSKLVFFDYGMNSLWGLKCNTECAQSSRFMMVNRAGQ